MPKNVKIPGLGALGALAGYDSGSESSEDADDEADDLDSVVFDDRQLDSKATLLSISDDGCRTSSEDPASEAAKVVSWIVDHVILNATRKLHIQAGDHNKFSLAIRHARTATANKFEPDSDDSFSAACAVARGSSSSASKSSSSSSSCCDSEEASSAGDEEGLKRPKGRNVKQRQQRKLAPRVPGEVTSTTELPPIETLHISVPEYECVALGSVQSLVEDLVVVKSLPGTPALDLDSVLFLDEGRRPLGKVFDVIGPVTGPFYVVRFNSAEHIRESGVEVGAKVFCAPRTEHTAFVFLDQLLRMKGSDASWKDDVEPPLDQLEFSDDEEERAFRKGAKSKGAQKRSAPGEAGSGTGTAPSSAYRPPDNKQASSNVFYRNSRRAPQAGTSGGRGHRWATTPPAAASQVPCGPRRPFLDHGGPQRPPVGMLANNSFTPPSQQNPPVPSFGWQPFFNRPPPTGWPSFHQPPPPPPAPGINEGLRLGNPFSVPPPRLPPYQGPRHDFHGQ